MAAEDDIKSFNTGFVNPFFLNGATWVLVYLVYQLQWSNLCPKLSDGLQIFLLSTVLISFVIGFIIWKRNSIRFHLLDKVSMKPLLAWSLILYLLLGVEILAQGGFPLLSYMSGSMTVNYKEFGLPVVHVIVVNGFSCLILFIYYSYISLRGHSRRDRICRFRLISLLCVDMLAFVVMFNRGALLACLAGIFIMMLAVSRHVWWLMVKLVAIGLLVLFAFGYMGNIRFGKNKMDMILKVGGITEQFRKSSIPNEFAWGYIYIATPLANTQNTINRSRGVSGDSEDLQNLVANEFMPEIFSKRFGEERGKKMHKATLIEKNLTASSIYGRGYSYFGWGSFWMIFGFLVLFVVVNMKIIPQQSKYYLPMIVTLDIIVVMNLFENMLVFMGLVPQVAVWIAFYLIGRKKLA